MSKTLEWVTDRRSPLGDIGIELEVERKTSWTGDWPHVRNWVAKTDGSLRNGIEYVTRSPVKVDEKLEERIKLLVDVIKDNVVDNSIRTSCHMHINMLRLTPMQMVMGCMSVWLVEDIVADYWGEERKGNNYCMRLSDGIPIENFTQGLVDLNTYGLGTSKGSFGSGRYYALNLSAFLKYGSVEFRGMRGTVDTKVLYDWARTIHHMMYTASKRYKTPLHLFENYMNTSNVVDFLKKIIGPYISDQLNFDDVNLDRVNDNAIKLAELAYYHADEDSDWEAWEANLISERSKRLEVPATTTTNSTTTQPEPGMLETFIFETPESFATRARSILR